MMCKLPDYILREFRENIDKVTALSKMSRKVLKLGSKNIMC